MACARSYGKTRARCRRRRRRSARNRIAVEKVNNAGDGLRGKWRRPRRCGSVLKEPSARRCAGSCVSYIGEDRRQGTGYTKKKERNTFLVMTESCRRRRRGRLSSRSP